jgi:hypothetical protein
MSFNETKWCDFYRDTKNAGAEIKKGMGVLNPVLNGLAYELCRRKILFVSL